MHLKIQSIKKLVSVAAGLVSLSLLGLFQNCTLAYNNGKSETIPCKQVAEQVTSKKRSFWNILKNYCIDFSSWWRKGYKIGLFNFGGADGLEDPITRFDTVFDEGTGRSMDTHELKPNDISCLFAKGISQLMGNMVVNPESPFGDCGGGYVYKDRKPRLLPMLVHDVDNSIYKLIEKKRIPIKEVVKVPTLLDSIPPIEEEDYDKNFPVGKKFPYDRSLVKGQVYDKHYGAAANAAAITTFVRDLGTMYGELDDKKGVLKPEYRVSYIDFQTNSVDMNNEEGFRAVVRRTNELMKEYGRKIHKHFAQVLPYYEVEEFKNRRAIQDFVECQGRRVPQTPTNTMLCAQVFTNNPEETDRWLDEAYRASAEWAYVMAASEMFDQGYNNVKLDLDVKSDKTAGDSDLILDVKANVNGKYLQNLKSINVAIKSAYEDDNYLTFADFDLKLDENQIKNQRSREFKQFDLEKQINLSKAVRDSAKHNSAKHNKRISWRKNKNNKFYIEVKGVFSDGKVKSLNRIMSNVNSFEIIPKLDRKLRDGAYDEKIDTTTPSVSINTPHKHKICVETNKIKEPNEKTSYQKDMENIYPDWIKYRNITDNCYKDGKFVGQMYGSGVKKNEKVNDKVVKAVKKQAGLTDKKAHVEKKLDKVNGKADKRQDELNIKKVDYKVKEKQIDSTNKKARVDKKKEAHRSHNLGNVKKNNLVNKSSYVKKANTVNLEDKKNKTTRKSAYGLVGQYKS